MRAYRDGIEADKSGSASPKTTTTTSYTVNRIGGYPSDPSSTFIRGKLDEMALWDGVVLSGANVVTLYNSGLGDDAAQFGTPERYYKFNGTGSDGDLIDEGSDGQDGLLFNFPGTGMWVPH
jgi:hypothetical protein